MAQLDNAADSDSEERGFESLRAGQKDNSILVVPLSFFVFNQTKGFEQGGSVAEENSPVDCFRRRGNERSEAIDAGASDKIPSSGPKIDEFRQKFVDFYLLLLHYSLSFTVGSIYESNK